MAAPLRVNDHTENYREAKGLCLFLNYLHKYELLGLHFQNSNPLLRLSMSTVYYFYLVNPITFDLSKGNSFSQIFDDAGMEGHNFITSIGPIFIYILASTPLYLNMSIVFFLLYPKSISIPTSQLRWLQI